MVKIKRQTSSQQPLVGLIFKAIPSSLLEIQNSEILHTLNITLLCVCKPWKAHLPSFFFVAAVIPKGNTRIPRLKACSGNIAHVTIYGAINLSFLILTFFPQPLGYAKKTNWKKSRSSCYTIPAQESVRQIEYQQKLSQFIIFAVDAVRSSSSQPMFKIVQCLPPSKLRFYIQYPLVQQPE